MNLETVVTLVAQHSSTPIETQNKIDRAERERALVQQMFSWIMWGMIVLGIGVAMLVTNKYFDLGRWFALASSCLLLGGTGIATFGLLNSIRQGVAISGKRAPREIPGATETKSLPTNPIPPALPSITERTTQLISGEDARPKR